MSAVKKETILVVDDEPQVLVALEDLLGSDYVVIKSESGETAMRAAQEVPNLAVVLSDQRMPNMSGDRLLADLQGVSDAARVLVTGYADLGAVVRAVNEGRIFAYVNKPWDPESLKLTVDRAVEHFRLHRDLARERALLGDLMNSVSDGIYIKDRELRFQRSNRAYIDLLSPHLPDEGALVGRKLSEIWLDGDARRVERDEAEVLLTGKAFEDVVQRVRTGDGFRWYSKSITPLRAQNGAPEAIVGIVRDVTERAELAEALKASEERQRLVIQASRAGLFDWDQLTGQVHYSAELAALLGEPVQRFTGAFAELTERLHPEDAPAVLQAIDSMGGEQDLLTTLECRLRTASGFRWFQLNAQAVVGESGRVIRLVGAIHDITSRKQQEERIAILSRVRAVLGEVNGTIARVRDRGGLLQRSCEIAVQVGQIPLAVVCGYEGGQAMRVVAVDGKDPELIDLVREGLEQGALDVQGDLGAKLRAGEPVIIDRASDLSTFPIGAQLLERGYKSMAWFPLVTGGRLEYVFALATKQGAFFDTQEVALLEELGSNIELALEHEAKSQRLHLLLSHDDLTRLARRDLFVDRLQQRLSACHDDEPYLAVLWLDINRFRNVNETLSRAGGDALLQDIARRLVAVVGDRDRLARLDANAFAIMSPPFESEADAGEFLAQVRRGVLDAPFLVQGTELRLSATTGVAVFPNDGADAEALLFHAETAGKTAKSNGQPYLFYTASMNQRVAEKLAMETRLRRAIQEEQFLLHFQPKVNLENGAVVGLEALIRWQDPENGLVPPGAFIPLLEETGLILDVGQWVLMEAARQFTAWRDAGLSPPTIAVNVSALQVAHDDFLDSLARVCSAYPFATEGLDLEITESVVMGDFSATVDKLKAARRLGLGVALDDFGTGYSSLSYLRRLPADIVKIDRSFVVRMDQSAADMAIVSTVISLAHSLGLQVVAEGVETTNQAHLLRLLRCDQIQGFLITKPLPADAVVGLLGERYAFDTSVDAIG
jgi:diguanylate cyclase (GGDEF)-like protein/PAS domain S-box-containing protein